MSRDGCLSPNSIGPDSPLACSTFYCATLHYSATHCNTISIALHSQLCTVICCTVHIVHIVYIVHIVHIVQICIIVHCAVTRCKLCFVLADTQQKNLIHLDSQNLQPAHFLLYLSLFATLLDFYPNCIILLQFKPQRYDFCSNHSLDCVCKIGQHRGLA